MEQIKKKFDKVAKELCELYEKKNKAYGNSFGETFQELGIISAITRISDKFNRLCTLSQNPDIDNIGESIDDTLRDLASYCVMTISEINSSENIEPTSFDEVMKSIGETIDVEEFTPILIKLHKKMGLISFVVFIGSLFYLLCEDVKENKMGNVRECLNGIASYCILAVANNEPTEPEIIEFP